jgi:hypothetical protein
MKKVYTSQDIGIVHYLKNMLEDNDIACVIKDENISIVGYSDRFPMISWPEIWVMDDSKEHEALEIIEGVVISTDSVNKSWKCTNCGEQVEGQFTECWNCGKSRKEEK